MILLCGIPSEPSLGLTVEAVRKLGAPHLVFHQRRFAEMAVELCIDRGRVDGRLQFGGAAYRLSDFTSIYTRMMDDNLLPEVVGLAPDAPERLYCRGLHATLARWFEIAPGRILNRCADAGSNISKPYQIQLIRRHGFAVPETLVTTEPELVREFRRQHGRIIYKSISYIRSIVHTLEDADLQRLGYIRWCPTQFQEYIEGENLRVHTVGERVFPTLIHAATTDYRYAYMEGEQEEMEPVELSDELAGRCVALSRALGLEFAGIDLKLCPDGRIYCLEVNPTPAYGYFQLHTGQPIADAVAAYLAGRD